MRDIWKKIEETAAKALGSARGAASRAIGGATSRDGSVDTTAVVRPSLPGGHSPAPGKDLEDPRAIIRQGLIIALQQIQLRLY